MSKLRSDAKWNELTDEQRDTLSGWLFEENLGYCEALERAQNAFGFSASLASLGRFYQRLAKERLEAELAEAQATAQELEQSPLDWEEVESGAMRLVANRLVQLAVAKPEQVKEMATLARVLIANEKVKMQRRQLELEEERREDEAERELEKMQREELRSTLHEKRLREFLGVAPSESAAESGAKAAPADMEGET